MNVDSDQGLKSHEPKPGTGLGLFFRVVEKWGV